MSATVVAVKVLKPGLTHDPRWEKRFQRELRLGRPIRHPNVCRIFDIGDADGYRFLTMEFATGGTLRDLIKKNEPLRPLPERLADAAGAIAGLAAIHDAGIVHRDVKPDNMLRMEDGRLVLSDFGLATDLPDSTMVSVFVGTPHYMAPEVREGDPATTRSDVWSLGVVLHEIFFGKRPERRTSRSGRACRGPDEDVFDVERAMLALCERCLADDPADRPADATRRRDVVRRAHAVAGRDLWSRARRRLALGRRRCRGRARGRRRDRVPLGGSRLPSSRLTHIPRLVNAGQPADWTKVAQGRRVRPGPRSLLLARRREYRPADLGKSAKAEDIDIDSGVAATRTALCPKPMRPAVPIYRPNRRELLFTANTASRRRRDQAQHEPPEAETRAGHAGMDPVWLMNGEEFVYSIDAYARGGVLAPDDEVSPSRRTRAWEPADGPG